MSPPNVFRFAPSPNGLLHLGHAFSALLNHDMARATAARLFWAYYAAVRDGRDSTPV